MRNVIHWSNLSHVPADGRPTQSAWYDHSYAEVPFTGVNDGPRIQSAIHKKVYRPSYGKFGGGTSLGTVKVVSYDPATQKGLIALEFIYHIGD